MTRRGGGIHIGNGGAVKFQNIIDIKTNHFDYDKYIPAILDLQKDKVNAYFFCNKTLLIKYLNEAIKRELLYDILLIKKLNPIPAKNNSYLPDLEYIVFLRSKGAYFNGKLKPEKYSKVFEKNNIMNKYHPNEKPFNLLKKFVEISSKPGDLVLDTFAGSGTTLLAARSINRNFIGFEILPRFVKTTNKRLEQKILI